MHIPEVSVISIIEAEQMVMFVSDKAKVTPSFVFFLPELVPVEQNVCLSQLKFGLVWSSLVWYGLF